MTDTAEMQEAEPVAWRYLSNAPNAKWTVQKNFPAPVEKSNGYSVEPLYSHAYVATLQAQITRLREALTDLSATGDNLLDCGNAVLGAVPGDPESSEAFDMFDAARGTWRLRRRDARALLSAPLPVQ